MHDEHGDVVVALQGAQGREHGRHLGGRVLVSCDHLRYVTRALMCLALPDIVREVVT
jgi:hypothetical protein